MLPTSIVEQLPTTLLAYLDPGTGSLMLQVMIAALFSGMFFMKSSFAMVRSAFSRQAK